MSDVCTEHLLTPATVYISKSLVLLTSLKLKSRREAASLFPRVVMTSDWKSPRVKALVRWATGKRLTNRLHKLSLITLSSPLNSGILGLRMGSYVRTPRFFYSLWGPVSYTHLTLPTKA